MPVVYMIMGCTCEKHDQHEMCRDGCDGDHYDDVSKRDADKMIREEPHRIKYVAKYIIRDNEIIGDDIYWCGEYY